MSLKENDSHPRKLFDSQDLSCFKRNGRKAPLDVLVQKSREATMFEDQIVSMGVICTLLGL